MSCLRVGLLLALAARLRAAAGGGGQDYVDPDVPDTVCAVQRQVLQQPTPGEEGRAEAPPAPLVADGAQGADGAAVAEVSMAWQDSGGEETTQFLPESYRPRMFVAIFSGTGYKYTYNRVAMRKVWRRADWMTVRLMVCSRPRELAKEFEGRKEKDIVFLDCFDSYARGELTKKAVLSMQYYMKKYPKVPYYFKTDDDTFVRPGPLLSLVEAYTEQQYIYGGVLKGGAPDRNEGSAWYEPRSNFPEGKYPRTALGGTGYVLSHDLVKQILDRGLPDKHFLFNEDRAVAVWVNAVNENASVRYVEIDGAPGYANHCETVNSTQKWRDFHWVLFHKLNITELGCISSRWPDDADVRSCFCK